MKRVLLFVVTNLAVLLVGSVVLGIVFRLLGIDPAAVAGGNYGALLIFAAVFGMGGAFVSLAMSKWSAKRMMGVHVIEQPQSDAEQWLVAAVQRHAQAAGIGMPEVGIFDAPQPNAFATGARRDKSLVAVSTGLLRGMNKSEVDAVLGHEISHVANGDMVTLALIQGVVNTFVIFLSRVVGEIIDRAVFRKEGEGRGIGYFLTVMVLQLAFGVLASMIVFWFSRRREYRADAGGARLAGRENMISALERLKGSREEAMPEQLRAFGIAGGGSGVKKLFMTHPPIEERIAALRTFQG